MDAPYSILEQVEPLVGRLLAENPSPYTYQGTQTYLVGRDELVVIDPGPALPDHLDAIEAAIGGRAVAAIACTHTHRDHSPAAAPLKERTGAPIIGCAPLALEAVGVRMDASFDSDYAPDDVLGDDDRIEFDDGLELIAVATPGHTSNHLCYALGDALFTGDHVMGWSTTVVVPPDGDMGAFIASLQKMQQRDDRIFFPAHGPPVEKPQQLLRGIIGHRLQREKQILRLVGEGLEDVDAIVAAAYPGLDERLIPAAGAVATAHLLDLQRRGLVEYAEDRWTRPKSND